MLRTPLRSKVRFNLVLLVQLSLLSSKSSTTETAERGATPRRVLLVAPQPFYEDRGTPIAVRLVLEALSELDYRVDVLTFPQGRPVEIPGVRLLRIPNPLRIKQVPIGFSLRKLLLDAVLVPALRRQLSKERYDCVHAVEEAAFPAAALAKRHGIPVIYDMQSSLPEQLAQYAVFRFPPVYAELQRGERWLLGEVAMVLSSTGLARSVVVTNPDTQVSEWTFPSRLGQPSVEKIAELRERLGVPRHARTVVYCGTFQEYQGLEKLLGAIPYVRTAVPNTVFILVGGTVAEHRAMEAYVRSIVPNGSLRIVERQPREAVASYLAMGDVLVSPRRFGHNLPLKIFDYLAAGRPIVATDIPPHRRVLHGERAILVPPTEAGLAEGIIRALNNPEEATRLATHARSYAEDHLGWERFVRELGRIYHDVCVGG